ncbi:unnamed protein product [Rotaria socialis]|uniref:Methyltransferase FkbM domain-containing protein n=1 Tax=Rotaria socialis TaxID=392032 RepID=A0A820P3R7_9BILA|nr:unnamed protein product [Rotaria socialis]CAF4400531.1 unnamed protein product [Rotaria socialis]
MRWISRYLFCIFCSVSTVIILITWSFEKSSHNYASVLQKNSKIFSDITQSNGQQTTANLAPNYLRYLYPQIWACQSANFEGKSGYYSQSREDEALHKWIFNNTKENQNPGIFVELGAANGITFSNTLFFERMFDWRGVLFEAQPENAKLLLKADREKTVKLPVAICSALQTHIRMLGGPGFVAGNIDTMDADFKEAWHKNDNKTVDVPCGPIGSYLTAIGITHIDLFSLDVEGGELSVLLTMNWNIQVHYLLIENNSNTPNIIILLKSHGFRVQDFKPCSLGVTDCTNNTLFVNEDYQRPNFSTICIPNIYSNIN